MRCLCLVLLAWPLATHSEPIQTSFQGLRLNANLVAPSGPGATAYLIVHGTWAHHGMEIIAALQTALAERGQTSLAPTLSLGMDDRTGFLSCGAPMRANFLAVLDEIDHWVDYLASRGWNEVIIVGHSRGGAQVALYQTHYGRAARMGLLAPMVWRWSDVTAEYDRHSDTPLEEVLSDDREVIGPYRLLRCDGVLAPRATFQSYYSPEVSRHTPALLEKITVPATVFLGTDDEITVWTEADRKRALSNRHVRIVEIDGADHFFRDLYLEDVADELVEGP